MNEVGLLYSTPHPTVLKPSLTVLKLSLTVLKLSLTILNLSLGGYALMNQNTTKEATETKMDHISVISIKKVHLSPTCRFRGQPL